MSELVDGVRPVGPVPGAAPAPPAPRRARRLELAAIVVVVAFFAAYGGAVLWCGWTGVQLLWSAFVLQDDRHVLGGVVGAAELAAAGLVVSSFFRRRATPTWRGVVVTATSQPTLFALVAQLARATSTASPDRVVLSDDVAVGATFAPGRAPRVLTLGLGLVGAIDRRALEAAIARELYVLARLASWPRRGLAYIEHLLGQYGLRELALVRLGLARLQRAFDRAVVHDATRRVIELGLIGDETMAALPTHAAAATRRLDAARRFVEREALHGLSVVDLFELQARIPLADDTAAATFIADAWAIFDRPEAVRSQVTAATRARPAWQAPLAATPFATTLARLDAIAARPHRAPRYRDRFPEVEPATIGDDDPRAAHRRLAATLSPAWAEALDSRWRLRRWAQHTAAELRETAGAVDDALAPARARGGGLWAAERIAAAHAGAAVVVHRAALHDRVAALSVPEDVRARLASPSWSSTFAVPLGPPAYDLEAWIAAMRHVVAIGLDALDELAAAALDEALLLEDRVVELAAGERGELPAAPSPAGVPADAPRPPRVERGPRPTPPRRQARGVLVSIGRTAAAVAVIGGAVVATHFVRKVEVVAYNGTGGPVVVAIDGERRTVAAGAHTRFHISAGRVAVSTRTVDGQRVEEFHEWIDERHRYVYDVATALPLLEETIVYAEEGHSVDVPDTRVLPVRRWHALTTNWLFLTPPKTQEVSKGGTKSYTRVTTIPREDPGMALGAATSPEDVEAILEAQLRWRPTSARFADAWWRAGSYLPGYTRLLEGRIARAPDDPLLRTLEQDHAGARHAAVCADHRARAAARPDDPSWQYLAARCLEPAARGAAMDAALARWPDEPWVLLGAGLASAARGDLVAADLRLTNACRELRSHCDAFAVGLARVRRGLGADPFLGLPIADGPDAHLVAPHADAWWLALARGDLAVAVQAADELDNDFDGVRARWLAAASDDAAPGFLADAEDNAAYAGGADPTLALVVYALRWRAGRAAPTDLDEAANAAAADAGPDAAHDAAALRGFLTLVTTADGAHADAADAALDPIAPVLRGRAYVAAAIILGPRCPARWRTLAQRLLFDHERPWFRP